MGLIRFIKGQFIDVIEWLDDSNNTLVWRFPDEDHEIKMGAKLTVREGQTAVFVNEGQIADVYPPGLYSLSTQNMPLLTSLKSWKYGFNSPFKAEVYFINTRQYLDLKWGTQNPIMMRDQDFGIVRVRAFGVYAIKVVDPKVFMREVVGTDGHFTTDEIQGQLRRMLVSSFTNAVGQAKIPVLDLAGNYEQVGKVVAQAMLPEFEKLGVTLAKFLIENISLPAEVEKAIDERSSIGAAGNLGTYTQFQAAKAMRESAGQPGGMAGMGVGLGAGVALGQSFGAALGQSLGQGAAHQAAPPAASPAAAAAPQAIGKPCTNCGAKVTPGAKFCPDCGTKQEPAGSFCPECGAKGAPGAKFCGECGTKMG
jgi:membrane protease subunit (stomatin/prohibitin family)